MIALVQCYIHILKNQEVNIRVINYRDMQKLTKAYNIAYTWLQEHNFKIYG
jgi:hypothetical protein